MRLHNELASDEDLDLVLMVPDAKPPVAKIISLNKYNYELEKASEISREIC